MHVYWLNKETKQYMGEGNDTDIDLSVETHLEMLQTDITPDYDAFEVNNEDALVSELHPFRWTGTGWELI